MRNNDQDITGSANAMAGPGGHASVRVEQHQYHYTPPPPLDPDALAQAQAHRAAIPLDRIPDVGSLPSGSVMPHKDNPFFVGRQDILITLAVHLRTPITSAPTLVITGIGGIGKTQLASGIAHRYGPFFAGGVFWLSCADPSIVLNEIARCGTQGLMAWRPDFTSLRPEEQAQLVLAAWQSPLPRLLIFDNCEDPALLMRWHPTTGGCVVLVTSRRATWPPTMAVMAQPLSVLQRAESVALLRYFRTDLAVDDPDLHAIAEELGDLPLALHLAGSYLHTMGDDITPAQYLMQLRAPDLFDHPSLQGWQLTPATSPTRHEQDVAKTFALSYTQLAAHVSQDRYARQMLQCAAACAPGEVLPRALIYALLDTLAKLLTDHAKKTIVRRLTDLGLVDQEAHGGIRLHHLLARFVQEQNESIEIARSRWSWIHRLYRIVRWRVQTDARSLDGTIIVKKTLLILAHQYEQQGQLVHITALLPHLQHVAHVLLSAAFTDATHCTRFAHYFTLIGEYTMAYSLYEQALHFHEDISGAYHSDTATSLTNLATLLHKQGKYTQARPLYERALAIREQGRGLIHLDTAASLTQLAHLFGDERDYTSAGVLYQSAIVIRQQLQGHQHPDTATCLVHLAKVLENQKEYIAAHPLYERALAIRERALGPDHPDTATSLTDLAMLLHTQGKYTQARPLYERALAIRKQVSGPDHPDTATSLTSLARMFEHQGEYTTARSSYERALLIEERALGPQHPGTATSLTNLAMLLHKQEEYTQARPLYERALAIREQVLGPQHPDTATSLTNLAALFENQGDYTQARPLYERALAIREQESDLEHPDTATSLTNLARSFAQQEKYDAARSLYERALAIREQVLGNHPNTATSLTDLAGVLRAQKEYDAARSLYERALAIREQVLGNHPDTTTSLANLAGVLRAQKEYDAAMRSFRERVLAIRTHVLGTQHPRTIMSLINLATLLHKQGEYTEARPLYERALAIREQVLGNHPNTATSLTDLATLLPVNRPCYEVRDS